jgi:hypothetical protein
MKDYEQLVELRHYFEENNFKITMPAGLVIDGSTVYKVKGSVPYTFSRDITIYPENKSDSKPMKITGYFLINGKNINQIKHDTELVVEMTLDDINYVSEAEIPQ